MCPVISVMPFAASTWHIKFQFPCSHCSEGKVEAQHSLCSYCWRRAAGRALLAQGCPGEWALSLCLSRDQNIEPLFRVPATPETIPGALHTLFPLMCTAAPAAEILNPILQMKKLRLRGGRLPTLESNIQKGNGGLGHYPRCMCWKLFSSLNCTLWHRAGMSVNLVQFTGTLSAFPATCCEPNYILGRGWGAEMS